LKAKNWDHRQRATINFKLEQVTDAPCLDLLITGVESSLWLGERFAQDLTTLFPAFSVKTCLPISFYTDCGMTGSISQASIVLAIGQSGQTFPTLQANALKSYAAKVASVNCSL